jgi:hypothetical protein
MGGILPTQGGDMRMFKVFGALTLAIFLSSCYTSGPAEFGTCMQDSYMANKYLSANYQYKQMIAGVDKSGKISCYVGEQDNIHVTRSDGWNQCKRDGNTKCGIVAINNVNYYGPPPTQTSDRSSSPSQNYDVFWYLLGSFAQGLAEGYASQSTYSEPARQRDPDPPPPHIYNCTSVGLTGGMSNSYTCR